MLGNHPLTNADLTILLIVVAFVLGSMDRPVVAGTFDKIGSEVRQPSSGSSSAPPRKRKSSKHAYCDDYCEDDDDAVESFFGKVFLAGVTSPFWAPHAALDDDISQAGTSRNTLTRTRTEVCCSMNH
jgi:hypothetical protein